jgi:hypothetical protein
VALVRRAALQIVHRRRLRDRGQKQANHAPPPLLLRTPLAAVRVRGEHLIDLDEMNRGTGAALGLPEGSVPAVIALILV